MVPPAPHAIVEIRRYFFFTYEARNQYRSASGNLLWDNKDQKFPSNKEIKEAATIRSGYKTDEIVITSIFEFKSKEDYMNFCGEGCDE